MKKFIIPFILSALSCYSYSQEFSQKYGQVNVKELNMKEYPKDKDAEALVIYDFGNSYFVQTDYGFEVVYERQTKIKIFNKAGLHWAEVEIPYYSENQYYELVSEIEATSYNLDNTGINKTPLDSKQIYDEKINEHWNQKKFAIPNVKEGSVIEYKYKIKSPFKFQFRTWQFQTSIPVVYSEFIAKMIPFYEYTYIMKGTNKFDVFENHVDEGISNHFRSVEYKDMVYKFGMKNVPAFRDETFITSKNDYIMQLDFQLSKFIRDDGVKTEIITTWQKLNDELLKHPDFGKYIKAATKSFEDFPELQPLVNEKPIDKVKHIVDFVKANYTWDEYNSMYANKKLKDFLKSKTGNDGNINLFLCGLLKASGLDALPVIISTREHGKIPVDYPFEHFFNYVIVAVVIDGTVILTDATEDLCQFNKVPPRCINDVGLSIKDGVPEWIKINNSDFSATQKDISIRIGPEMNNLQTKIAAVFNKYEAYKYRNKYNDDKEKIESDLKSDGYENIDSTETENYKDPEKNYKITYNAEVPIEKIENKIYISPFLYESIKENPLKQTVRLYPVDMIYPTTNILRSEIKIPDGYKADFIPDTLKIKNDLVDVNYNAGLIGSNILVNGTYMFKKAVYNSDEYRALKFMFSEIIKKFNEKIVIVKE